MGKAIKQQWTQTKCLSPPFTLWLRGSRHRRRRDRCTSIILLSLRGQDGQFPDPFPWLVLFLATRDATHQRLHTADDTLAELFGSPCVDILDDEVNLEDVSFFFQFPIVEDVVVEREIFRIYSIGIAGVRCGEYGLFIEDTTLFRHQRNRTTAVTYQSFAFFLLTPINMRTDCPCRPYEAKNRYINTQRMQVANNGCCRHSVLPICIVQHDMRRLLVFEDATDKLEPRRFR